MVADIGPQYDPDDLFKAAARRHQSHYRATVLKADYCEYGNRLTESDGRALLNYYDGLGVRETLRQRYPRYNSGRDADMLRSEHIPFNMLAPLKGRPELTRHVLSKAFGLTLDQPYEVRLEWDPKPAASYLDDRTSFDTYIQGMNADGQMVGVGIEVKYTERSYRIGSIEAKRLQNPTSTYWTTTQNSGQFLIGDKRALGHDELRQIWRNHLLGLSMVQQGDIADFVSITLYPAGNQHFTVVLRTYQEYLVEDARRHVRGCTFEAYIDCLDGDSEIEHWKAYLGERYLVKDKDA